MARNLSYSSSRRQRNCGTEYGRSSGLGVASTNRNRVKSPDTDRRLNPVTTYFVESMRVVFPTGKVAERRPNRWATVHGTFYASVDVKGKATRGEKLSIPQKEITREMATDAAFAIDPEAGTLSLPSGTRGAPQKIGASNDDILASLKALRNPSPQG